MVSSNHEKPLVHGIRLSSVGSGRATGQDVTHEPAHIDLAMKLHYLRLVYYFPSQAVSGLTVKDFKEPSFTWLNGFFWTCGRFRREEGSGRPYIKCNDCGIRFIEAHCEKTLDEWLEMRDCDSMGHDMLVYGQPIGPEMQFSPLVLLQLTFFKCGGISMGLSWAHVLGDAFAASEFMAELGKAMSGQDLAHSLYQAQNLESPISPNTPLTDPLSLKRVGPVGDHWIIPNNCKMETFSYHLTSKQISHLQSKVCGKNGLKAPAFESLCAIIWKSIAKIGNGPKPKLVTICKNDSQREKINFFGNGQVINTVEAEFPVAEANLDDIVELLSIRTVDDRTKIEEEVQRDQGLSDYIIYGANLTFLDLEGADLYGFEIKGLKPTYTCCTIDGVGEEGLVLVSPRDDDGGNVVILIMPENDVFELKSEIEREFEIA